MHRKVNKVISFSIDRKILDDHSKLQAINNQHFIVHYILSFMYLNMKLSSNSQLFCKQLINLNFFKWPLVVCVFRLRNVIYFSLNWHFFPISTGEWILKFKFQNKWYNRQQKRSILLRHYTKFIYWWRFVLAKHMISN